MGRPYTQHGSRHGPNGSDPIPGGCGCAPPFLSAFLPWAWYDFSDLSTLTLDGSGNIGAVQDKSGLGHHISQTNASLRPTPSTLNALGAATFNSSDPSGLSLTIDPAPDPLPQPQIVFVVWTQTAVPADPPRPGPFDIGGADLFITGNNATLRLQQGLNKINANVGDPGVPSAPFTQLAMTCLMNGVASPFSSAIRVQGNQYNGLLDGGTVYTVNLGGVSDHHMDGQIGELLIYGGPFTDGQITSVESYLQGKWNAP